MVEIEEKKYYAVTHNNKRKMFKDEREAYRYYCLCKTEDTEAEVKDLDIPREGWFVLLQKYYVPGDILYFDYDLNIPICRERERAFVIFDGMMVGTLVWVNIGQEMLGNPSFLSLSYDRTSGEKLSDIAFVSKHEIRLHSDFLYVGEINHSEWNREKRASAWESVLIIDCLKETGYDIIDIKSGNVLRHVNGKHATK